MTPLLRLLTAAAILLGLGMQASAPADGRVALLLEVDGAIGPAVADYVARGLEAGAARGAAMVILRLDTPGGLDSAMRVVVKAILDSPVPVAVYVAPGGARAASAGTYILYASPIAAMAPATNLGAATPVSIGGLPGLPEEPARPDHGDGEPGDAGEGGPADSAMDRKVVSDAAAYLRALAQRHGRNVEWAERAVRESASLTAEEALAAGVVDLIATDVGDLLERVDGRRVRLATGEVTLATRGLAVERLEPDWRSRLLAVITDPNVAYILMLVGIYGLIFELSNPGAVLPGVAGAISLLLALYAFQVLPINYAGLALIAVGIAFMVAEAFVPSFGALGLGGVLAFVTGSVILLDEGELAVSIPVIAGTAAVSAGFFIWVLARFAGLRRRRALAGTEELVGAVGVALADFERDGRVRVRSESWRARTHRPVRGGQRVRVVAVDGLALEVERVDPE
jgi:membrane-bound serine protease (ClpP class)